MGVHGAAASVDTGTPLLVYNDDEEELPLILRASADPPAGNSHGAGHTAMLDDLPTQRLVLEDPSQRHAAADLGSLAAAASLEPHLFAAAKRTVDEAALLEAILARHARSQCYTWVGQRVLLSVHSAASGGSRTFGPSWQRAEVPAMVSTWARDGSVSAPAPHVHSLAEDAYAQATIAARDGTSPAATSDQALVFSGERGAGKSFQLAAAVRYVCARSRPASGTRSVVEEALLCSCTVLDPLLQRPLAGSQHASHAARVVKVAVDGDGVLRSATLRHFALSTATRAAAPLESRAHASGRAFGKTAAALRASPEEMGETSGGSGTAAVGLGTTLDCFAIFTHLCAAPESTRSALHLDPRAVPSASKLHADGSGSWEWQQWIASLHGLGIGQERSDEVIALLAALLHLGELCPSTSKDHGFATIDDADSATGHVAQAAALLRVPSSSLVGALTQRSVVLSSDVDAADDRAVPVPLLVSEAVDVIRELCQLLYRRLCTWLEAQANEHLASSSAASASVPTASVPKAVSKEPEEPASGKRPTSGGAAAPGRRTISFVDLGGFEVAIGPSPTEALEALCTNLAHERLHSYLLESLRVRQPKSTDACPLLLALRCPHLCPHLLRCPPSLPYLALPVALTPLPASPPRLSPLSSPPVSSPAAFVPLSAASRRVCPLSTCSLRGASARGSEPRRCIARPSCNSSMAAPTAFCPPLSARAACPATPTPTCVPSWPLPTRSTSASA